MLDRRLPRVHADAICTKSHTYHLRQRLSARSYLRTEATSRYLTVSTAFRCHRYSLVPFTRAPASLIGPRRELRQHQHCLVLDSSAPSRSAQLALCTSGATRVEDAHLAQSAPPSSAAGKLTRSLCMQHGRQVKDRPLRPGGNGTGAALALASGLCFSQQARVLSVICPVQTPGKHAFIMNVMPRVVCLQNLALNIAEKGFPISVYNRSYEKTEAAMERAKKAGASQKPFRRWLNARCSGCLFCRPEV